MKSWWRTFERHWPLAVWAVVAVFLFWPVRGYYVALPSSDSGPFFAMGGRLRLVEQILAGFTAVTPHHLLSLAIPPLPLNDFFYFFDTLMVAIGVAWFLRGRDLPPAGAAIGGGIMAFAGYSFTLVPAGHMGLFHMTVYAVFMFGALVRAIRVGWWPYYALAGILAAWTITFAPDFGALMLALAALYGIWLICRNADNRPWSQRWKPLACGALLAALCFGLGAWPAMRTVFTENVAHREAQIASVTPGSQTPAGNGENEGGEDAGQARWIFATNWSLHPGEIVEFVAPNIFGTQSGDPQAPYWGKLGRTFGWEQHRQGFPNFRQHTIYLGALQLMLAAFAVGAWWSGRGRKADGRGDKGEPPAMATAPLWLSDIPFWGAVWMIGLLLAFGRHAPFYRLFYSLPYMSLLRAPVKFIRFVELATAVMAASGAGALLAAPQRRRRGWIMTAGGAALAAGAAALWGNGAADAVRQALEPLHLAGMAPLLQRNMVLALLHGGGAFGVAALVFYLAGGSRARAVAATAVITLWLAIDLAAVDRRFIQAWDLSAHYQANRVVRQVLESGGPDPVVANYITPNQVQDWFSFSFAANGIFNCAPSPQSQDPFAMLHNALKGDPLRYWELCGARHVILPMQAARALAGPRLKPVAAFQLGRGQVVAAQDPGSGAVIAEVPQAMPYAWLAPAWSVVTGEESLGATAARATLQRAVVVGAAGGDYGNPATAPGTVKVVQARYENGKFRTILDVSAPAEQVLVLRSRVDAVPPLACAFVDGVRHGVLRVNHCWIGVLVPPGAHRVELTADRRLPACGVNLLPMALAAAAVIGLACAGGGNKPSKTAG